MKGSEKIKQEAVYIYLYMGIAHVLKNAKYGQEKSSSKKNKNETRKMKKKYIVLIGG